MPSPASVLASSSLSLAESSRSSLNRRDITRNSAFTVLYLGLRRGGRLVVAHLALQDELGLQVFKYVAQLVENTITFLLVLTNRISAGNAPLALPRGRVGVAGGAGEIIFFSAEGRQQPRRPSCSFAEEALAKLSSSKGAAEASMAMASNFSSPAAVHA